MTGLPDFLAELEPHLVNAYRLIEAAVLKGERCPVSYPRGPLPASHLSALTARGIVRSEVSGRNFRRVVILKGPLAGQGTAMDPYGRAVWMVNGRHIDVERHSARSQPSAPQPLGKIAP